MTQTLRATIFACAFIITISAVVCAQQSTPTKHEVWPEIDLYFPLNERLRLFAMSSEERSGEEGEGFKTYVGIHLDYFWKKRWNLRAGYRYGFRIGSGDSFHEHRPQLEANYSRALSRGFAIHARHLDEFRFINGDFSLRFRNRLRLERDLALGKRLLVPYSSGEIYYDTRFHTFNRLRLTAGLEFRFKRRTSALLNVRRQKTLDFYYVWQHDSRSSPARVEAVGVTFAIHF